MQIDDLTQTLDTYSGVANGYIDLISTALRPIGLILIAIFFILELNNWKKMLEIRGQSITKNLWIELAVKYLIAVVLVMASDVILGAIFEIGNIITKVINQAVPLQTFNFTFTNVEGLDWFTGRFVSLLGGLVQAVSHMAIVVVLFMRFIELYLLKAIAPIIIAFFMSDAFRSITINYFKTYSAYTLASTLILVLSIIFTSLINTEVLKGVGNENLLDAAGIAYFNIAKGVVYILMIIGVIKKTKSMLGAS